MTDLFIHKFDVCLLIESNKCLLISDLKKCCKVLLIANVFCKIDSGCLILIVKFLHLSIFIVSRLICLFVNFSSDAVANWV